ncbi:hypothetical protein [Burkholderia savannae]|uniref:Uncharacterized protein n=2 Tax=Burkholderia TaxID=32008 RepID=A0ABR5T7V9_9BURK|nr:hypothetical protein WS78_20150 [Burkholderia savannae]AOK51078.1 hypothetical protein WT60_21960 [Burkholderia sp. MSMB617WGS]KVG48955.1 hypothetical protein WS77_03195 [Burkholderia sp. MSMB0265]KVG86413.1 hypothetical protein WS81_29865 [Burkholderia sp. MSMB2040]KVG90694.1 hypothetical protein WS82_17330 [Burkholderia sp. MSMB2041]KVH00346.1 hypothetical protein WS83_23105 [Burkholderia sp. MSMB2042]
MRARRLSLSTNRGRSKAARVLFPFPQSIHIHSETIMSVNGISLQTLHPSQFHTSSTSPSSRDRKIEELLHEIEELLMQGDSGGGDDTNIGGDSNDDTPAGNNGPTNHATPPAGGKPGEDLRDVKLNTKAGGEALHLKMDSQGNLYNGSNNSVGVVDKDGNVKLNAGATKELERLESGGNPFVNAHVGKRGAGGNMEFTPDEVTVSAGDLKQKADF